MKSRIKTYEKGLSAEFLLLREQSGMKEYRKHSKRYEEKREMFLEFALKKGGKREGRLNRHPFCKRLSRPYP
jgi:hypothetical protein